MASKKKETFDIIRQLESEVKYMPEGLISHTVTEDKITDVWKNEHGCTIIVTRPILTDEEREIRMERVKKAAAKLLMSKKEVVSTA